MSDLRQQQQQEVNDAEQQQQQKAKLHDEIIPSCPEKQNKLTHLLRLVTKMNSSFSPVVLPSTPAADLRGVATIAIATMPMIEVQYNHLTMPDNVAAAAGCVNGNYIRHLEAAGVRCYILDWQDPWPEQLKLLSCVGGVLLPGGDLDLFPDMLAKYQAFVRRLYNYVTKEANGDLMLWAVCQGYECICAAAAASEDESDTVNNGLDIIEPGFVGVERTMLNVDLIDKDHDDGEETIRKSRFLTELAASPRIFDFFTRHKSTLNVHRLGIPPETFQKNERLRDAFMPLGTSKDQNGRAFVAAAEHRTAPIYAVQFHPEWPAFDFCDERVQQTDASLELSSWIAHFVRRNLRKSSHHFQTLRAMEGQVAERSPLQYDGWGWQFYYAKSVTKPKSSPSSPL